jgi:[ribosomal protein S5]-alanine N-acetyltransferase
MFVHHKVFFQAHLKGKLMIVGKNVNIRHIQRTDLDILCKQMNQLDLRGNHFTSGLTSQRLLELKYDKDGMSNDEFERLLMVDKDDNIIGFLAHFKSSPYLNAREIAYQLFPLNLRGKGITTESVILLSHYLFETLPVNRLELRMHIENIASERVAVKSGYQKEGICRECSFVRGRNVDLFVYSRLRREWEATVKRP